ncbi:MAG: type II secretion system F family protein [Candidatus Micrarchaeota archaeon]
MREKLFFEELESIGIRKDFKELILLLGGISGAIGIAIHFLLAFPFPLEFLIPISVFILPPSLLYSLLGYLKDKKQKDIDSDLPGALFQISSYPQNTPMEKIIEESARRDSPLGREFKKAHNMISAGYGADQALLEISNDNNSPLLKRAISMLLEAYESGEELMQPLGGIASDILEMHALQRELASALSLQKYTVLGAAGILVPAILGLLLGAIAGMNLDFDFGIFGKPQSSAYLLPTIAISIQIYLFLLSILASAFIAMQEGKLKKAPVYFCMLAPSSILLFNLLKGAAIF